MGVTQIEWTATYNADGSVTPGRTWSPLRVRVREKAAEIARAKGYASLVQIAEKMAGHVGPHCEKVSEGCTRCYSESNNGRCLPANGTGLPFDRRSRDLVESFVDEKILRQPLGWRKPCKAFVENQSDLFGEWNSDEMIDRVFAVMSATKHTYQILTKRAERLYAYFNGQRNPRELREAWGLRLEDKIPRSNIWLGVSAENRDTWDERVYWLRQTPAAVRFVSYEPALGPLGDVNLTKIHWVIVGGESGAGARPMHASWVRELRDRCAVAGVAYFFKQWGEFKDGSTCGPDADWKKDFIVLNDGRYCREDELDDFQKLNRDTVDGMSRWAEFAPNAMARVGKKKAGRLLAGREWNEFPEVRR